MAVNCRSLLILSNSNQARLSSTTSKKTLGSKSFMEAVDRKKARLKLTRAVLQSKARLESTILHRST